MENPRKLVTASVAQYLKTPILETDGPRFRTGAKGRVFDTDSTPPDVDSLAEINVLFVEEEIDPQTQHQGGPRRRIMEMRVECYHTKSKDNADDLAWEVEEALRENPTLSNSVEWLTLQKLNLFVVENQSVALFAVVMTYQVIYWTHQIADPDTGRPVTVLLGYDPHTGPGHEPDYEVVIGE